MTRYAGAPAQKTGPAGGGSGPAAGGSGALDLDQLAADLGSGTVNRAPAGGGSRIWNLGFCKPGLHKNGQLYVSPATRHAGGGVINCEIDTKKAALRPL